jgi:hypothetical protein
MARELLHLLAHDGGPRRDPPLAVAGCTRIPARLWVGSLMLRDGSGPRFR